MSKQTILAWHFTDGMKYRDGSALVVGQPCPHIENISIYHRGYHASEDILHALKYAPGLYLSRTEHSGDVKRQADKICSQDRTPLWTIDFTGVMIEFVKACVASAKISADQAANAAAARAVVVATYANAAAAYAAAYAAYAARGAAYAAYAARAAAYANASSAAAAYAAANASSAAAYAAATYAARAAAYAARAVAAATYAARAAAYAAAAERTWQSVVLLQLISNEYDRLCEAV